MGTKQQESQALSPFIKLKNPDGTESVHYYTFYPDVPSEFLAIAKRELNETEENKREGLRRLKNFMRKEGITDVHENILLASLRCSKYDFAKSEERLKKYLKIRNKVFHMLQDADFERLEKVLDHLVLEFLPYRDKHGRPLLVGACRYNFDLFDVHDSVICFYCCCLLGLTCPLTSITGVCYLADSKTLNLSTHYPVMKAYIDHIPKVVQLPLRIKKVMIINESPVIRWGFKILRPFLKSKLLDRITFCGTDLPKMLEEYHPALLPEEFGGTMSPRSTDFYKEDLLNFMKKIKSGQFT